MLKVPDGEKIIVAFNERGQPILKSGRKNTTFLGVIVKEIVPVTIKTYADVSDNIIAFLWTAVKVYIFQLY